MKKLLRLIKWDFTLILKYGIVAVASVIALIYCAAILLLDIDGSDKLISVLIFSDPVMYGFLFTAAIVLFEKDANIHQALAVSPLSVSQYLWSKTFVFTTVALVYSSAIVLAFQPGSFNPFPFITGVVLSSTMFVFIGMVGVSYVKNFNQFILLMPIVLAPACLPFLGFFSVYESPLFYIVPTQACLLLFEASFAPVELWEMAYALIYIAVCNIILYKLALHHYERRILKISRNE
jgi:fluoroquinolone transport system permease protein